MPLSSRLASMLAVAALLLTTLGAAPDAVAATPATTRVVCRAPVVKVRAAPSRSAAIRGTVKQGQKVTGRQVGTWLELGRNRWMAAYYTCARAVTTSTTTPRPAARPPAKPAARKPARPAFVVCRAPVVRVRAAPSRSAAIRGTVKRGQKVTGRRVGTWLDLGAGRWMAAYYTCAPAAKKAAPPRSAPPARKPASRASARGPRPVSSVMLQPVSTFGTPTSPFGRRFHPIYRTWRQHSGVDIGGACQAPITAAHAGVVTRANWSPSGGWTVVVNDGRMGGVAKVESKYLHLAGFTVRPGQKVRRGQTIGRVGSTGASTKCHLHFGTYENGRAVDPQRYLGPLRRLANF